MAAPNFCWKDNVGRNFTKTVVISMRRVEIELNLRKFERHTTLGSQFTT